MRGGHLLRGSGDAAAAAGSGAVCPWRPAKSGRPRSMVEQIHHLIALKLHACDLNRRTPAQPFVELVHAPRDAVVVVRK